MARTKQTMFRETSTKRQGVTSTHKVKARKERQKKLSRAEAEERLKNNPDDQEAFEAIVTLAGAGRKKQVSKQEWQKRLDANPGDKEAKEKIEKLTADAARKKAAYQAAGKQQMAGKERITKKQTDAVKTARANEIMKDLGHHFEKKDKKKEKAKKQPVELQTMTDVLREFADRPPEHQVAVANESTHQMVNIRPKNLRSQVFTLPGVKKLITNKHDAGKEYNAYIEERNRARMGSKEYDEYIAEHRNRMRTGSKS